MKYTNRQNLPDALCEAVKRDPYTRGDSDASITQLLKPPRMVALEKQHEHEIVEDCSDRIWSLMGQAVHTILERANRAAIAERRLAMEIEGWRISGGMDLYDEDGTLTDYKVTSAWSVKDGAKEEWVEQLNCYAVILRANRHKVKVLKVVAILRDWSKLEAARDPVSYPQAQVMTFTLPLWEEDKAFHFLRNRVVLHQQAQRKEMPLCSADERWAKPTVYAVMKAGSERAVRGGLFDNEADAVERASRETGGYVQKRLGENTRCKFYCSVSKFCIQHESAQKALAYAG